MGEWEPYLEKATKEAVTTVMSPWGFCTHIDCLFCVTVSSCGVWVSRPVEMLKIDSCQEWQASILFSFLLLTFSLRVAGLQMRSVL